CSNYFGFLQAWANVTSAIANDAVLVKALTTSIAQHASLVRDENRGYKDDRYQRDRLAYERDRYIDEDDDFDERDMRKTRTHRR
ncbi:MAG: hypothetical protein J6Y65_02330, partial [Eggerthellaceae bacterium]|nr:hypothetical protein [Eggerthellaceae bacterium]